MFYYTCKRRLKEHKIHKKILPSSVEYGTSRGVCVVGVLIMETTWVFNFRIGSVIF
jgi:hypothetical protein